MYGKLSWKYSKAISILTNAYNEPEVKFSVGPEIQDLIVELSQLKAQALEAEAYQEKEDILQELLLYVPEEEKTQVIEAYWLQVEENKNYKWDSQGPRDDEHLPCGMCKECTQD